MVGTGMAHFDQGIGSDPFGQQDAGGVEQWLPGAANQTIANVSIE
jgi:hypothetical protein